MVKKVDVLVTDSDDSEEQIIIARNNEVYNPCSKYIGVEVAIGTIDDNSFADDLENLALDEDLLWQRYHTGGVNMDDGKLVYVLGSKFLDDTFRKFNNLYHRTGLLFKDDLTTSELDGKSGIDIDRLSESTDNWVFGESQYRYFSFIEIPDKGNVILSIRLQDFHFKAQGKFHKLLKRKPQDIENTQIYNTEKKFYENINSDRFFVKPCIDYFDVFQLDDKQLIHPFSILFDVMLDNGEQDVIIQKEVSEDPLWYYSVHIIYRDGKIIGFLSTNNHPFNEDSSFPFYKNEKDNCMPDLLYCISPCPKDNIKFSSTNLSPQEYTKQQDFIYQDQDNGSSRSYGIPVNEREVEYRDTIGKLISLLRQ